MSHFVEVNGLRMHFLEQGTGPLVVLLHGFPELSISWHKQIPALVAAGYRVVAPDQRGYGQTDAPESTDAYTMFHLVGDVIGLLDALGEQRAVVIGHDWGAPVAWSAAMWRPDRVRAVGGLSVPPRGRATQRPTDTLRRLFGENFYQLRFQTPGVAEREFEADIRTALRRLMYTASGDAPDDQRWNISAAGSMVERMADPGAAPAWLGEPQLDALAAAFARTGLRGGLSWYRNIDRNWELSGAFTGLKIHQPSLFMIGDRDPTYAVARPAVEALGELATDLRHSAVLAGCGHWIGEERPDEVNAQLVKFLAGLPA
jgi:pimeloyl-ACP methyl ester carboxylesterase